MATRDDLTSSAAGRGASLSVHKRTQLRSGSSEALRGWSVGIYEGTGEATACFRSGSEGQGAMRPESAMTEEERQLDNEARSARRRQTGIRRYTCANELLRLWTFTYDHPELDRAKVLRDWAAFVRRFYGRFGRMPWVRVLEHHKGGWCVYCKCDHPEGRYHVHAALPNVFLPHHVMAELWGHGFVQFEDRKAREGRVTPSKVELSRKLAGYLAKYIAKECEAGFAEHAYDVAQGYPVVCRRVRHVRSIFHVRRVLERRGFGAYIELSSDDWVGFRGPPTRFFVSQGAGP